MIVVGFQDDLDYREFEFIDKFGAHRKCAICGVISSTIVELCCRHFVCSLCSKNIEAQKVCPIDKQVLDFENVNKFTYSARTLRKRRVRCTNAKAGCDFEGTLGDYLEHHRSLCEFVNVTCPRCSVLVPHRKFIRHVQSDKCNDFSDILTFSRTSSSVSLKEDSNSYQSSDCCDVLDCANQACSETEINSETSTGCDNSSETAADDYIVSLVDSWSVKELQSLVTRLRRLLRSKEGFRRESRSSGEGRDSGVCCFSDLGSASSDCITERKTDMLEKSVNTLNERIDVLTQEMRQVCGDRRNSISVSSSPIFGMSPLTSSSPNHMFTRASKFRQGSTDFATKLVLKFDKATQCDAAQMELREARSREPYSLECSALKVSTELPNLLRRSSSAARSSLIYQRREYDRLIKIQLLSEVMRLEPGDCLNTHVDACTYHWKVEDLNAIAVEALYSERVERVSPTFGAGLYRIRLEITFSRGLGGSVRFFLSIRLVRGPQDDIVRWPFTSPFTFSLVHPFNSDKNISKFVDILAESNNPDIVAAHFAKPQQFANQSFAILTWYSLDSLRNAGFLYDNGDCLDVIFQLHKESMIA